MPQISNLPHEIEIFTIPYHTHLALELFQPISNLPWAMLLRSSAIEHPNNRFDILVARPKITLETKEAQTYIHDIGKNQTQVSDLDPFTLIQNTLSQALPRVDYQGELPFIGGAVGYFSYDLGRQVETIPSIALDDPNAKDMSIGIYDWALICDHQKQQAWVVGHDVKQQFDWLTQQSKKKNKTAFAITTPWQANMSYDEYNKKFNQVQTYIQQGDCYQINLAQRFETSYQGDEWQAYLKLEQKNLAPFSAFIRTPNTSILSLSPERFISLKNNEIETKPIKGTRPRFQDKIQDEQAVSDLKLAPKDRAENLMIVDLLRNDIGRVAQPGSVNVPHLFEVESFPAVHHLVSTIRAQLDKQYQATDLLRACFPGGSITGAPKVRAMQIIESLEPHRRDAYCGSIGYLSRCGQMDTNISIRTLVARNNKLYAWAGGGLVADSQAEDEYQETLDKLSHILPILPTQF